MFPSHNKKINKKPYWNQGLTQKTSGPIVCHRYHQVITLGVSMPSSFSHQPAAAVLFPGVPTDFWTWCKSFLLHTGVHHWLWTPVPPPCNFYQLHTHQTARADITFLVIYLVPQFLLNRPLCFLPSPHSRTSLYLSPSSHTPQLMDGPFLC